MHLRTSFLGQRNYWSIVCVLTFLGLGETALARPRVPQPPYPEARVHSETFDEAFYSYALKTAPAELAGTDLVESWSGYALRREGASVTPFTVAAIGAGGRPNFFMDRSGSVRFWFRPAYSTLGLGDRQPRDYARLIELVALTERSSELVWSVCVDPTGRTIYWSGKGRGQIEDFLTAEINWRSGEWHLVALSYTPTNVSLFLDGNLAAIGNPFTVPQGISQTNLVLVLGSSLDGNHCAQGQFEEVCNFSHPARLTDIACYWELVSKVAAKGAVSAEEDQALQAELEARKAALSTQSSLTAPLDGGGGTLLEGGETNFWLLPPVIEGTNVTVSLLNADPSKSYDLFYSQILVTNFYSSPSTMIVATGALGQASFTLPWIWPIGFWGAAEGNDWDGDGVPNWIDANPRSTNVGALTVTIETPAHNSTLR